MCACPALRPRRDLHVRPWAYGKPEPDYERFVARDYRGPCLLHSSPTSLKRVDTAFRTSTRRRLPQLTYFGAQSHSLHTRCLRFATWVTPMPRKTRFRLVASLYRAELIARWVPLQGFSNASSLLPPCPSFPGARRLKYGMATPSGPGMKQDKRKAGTLPPLPRFTD